MGGGEPPFDWDWVVRELSKELAKQKSRKGLPSGRTLHTKALGQQGGQRGQRWEAEGEASGQGSADPGPGGHQEGLDFVSGNTGSRRDFSGCHRLEQG